MPGQIPHIASLSGSDPANDDMLTEPDSIGSNDIARPDRNTIIARLYDEYFAKLVQNLRGLYGSGPPDPQDVAHQAFEWLTSRGKLENIDDMRSYLWIAARNILISGRRHEDMRRAKSHTISEHIYGEQIDTIDPERMAMASEELEIVAEAIATMPEKRRQIFLLNRVHGLTPEAAGRRFGISRSAAIKHIAKALADIDRAFGATMLHDDESGGVQ
ncbi:MAG: sigma-70 family RNA polymerase sigma factor [Pseudomonadota bacterium]